MINTAWKAWTKGASLEDNECIVSKANTNDKMLKLKDRRKAGGVARLGASIVKRKPRESVCVVLFGACSISLYEGHRTALLVTRSIFQQHWACDR